jgi:hypothetical protein
MLTKCKRLRIYRKLGTRVNQKTNPSATNIGFGLSRRSSSTNCRIALEQCQRRQEALELDIQQCQRSQEAPAQPTQKIKRSIHVLGRASSTRDTNVAIAYSVDTLTVRHHALHADVELAVHTRVSPRDAPMRSRSVGVNGSADG